MIARVYKCVLIPPPAGTPPKTGRSKKTALQNLRKKGSVSCKGTQEVDRI